jgi:O-antigen/teichoic acid export membrane protein
MNFAWSLGRHKDADARAPTAVTGGNASKRQDRHQDRHSASDQDHARGVYPLYFLANIATRASMLVVLIVLTRLLPAAEYGLFALVVTVGEILEMGSSNWVRVYLLRTEAGAHKIRPRQLGRALLLSAGGTVAALAVSMLIAPFISAERVGGMMLAVAVYIAAFSLLRTTLMLAQLSRSHIPYAVIETARAIIVVAATIVFARLYPQSFLPASLALSLATGACAALGLLFARSLQMRTIIPRGGYLAALSFGVPFLLANCLAYAIGWSDRFVLNYFLGPAAVGVYVAAYSIARQPVELFVGALNNFTFPLLVQAYAADGSRKAGPIQSGLMITIATLGIGIVAGLSLVAEPLATLLFPPSYRADVVMLIPWIAAATFILSIKQFIFDNGLHVTQQNWPHLFTMVPTVLISVALGIVLVRHHGIFGAAINYVVVATVATCASAVFSFRVLSFAIPWATLAKTALSAFIATSATWATIHHSSFGVIGTLVAAVIVFCSVYGGLLTLSGFSLWRMVETPWLPLRNDPQADRISSNSVS